MIESLESRIVLATTSALLTAKLAEFAADKTAQGATPQVPTFLTAKADDLVLAVYRLAGTPDFDNATEVSDLVATALTAQNGKVRADKDKIAPRLVAAALLGSRLVSSPDVAQIVTALANVNSSDVAKLQLTAAGKEAVVAQALKINSDGDTTIGADLAEVAETLALAAPGTQSADAKLQSFVIATLKSVGAASGQVRSFTDTLLDAVTGDKEAFGISVASGLASTPEVAGLVIGGLADELGDPGDILTMTGHAVANPKLAKAIAAAVAGSANAPSILDAAAFVSDLLPLLPASKLTAANRAAIASGAIQSNAASDVDGVIDAALGPVDPAEDSVTLTKAQLSTFAGGAATDTGDRAADVVAKIASLAEDAGFADAPTLTNIGKAVVKAIAVSSPGAAGLVARAVVTAGGTLFGSDLQKTTLAGSLATAAPTNGAVTGAAAAGVGATLNANAPTADQLAAFAVAVIQKAPKSAQDIAMDVARLSAVTDYKSFAVQVATQSTATAPAVAAGVALASAEAAGGHPAPNSGQTAGDIAVAVAKVTALQPKLLTIAGAVAEAIDLESIAGLAGKAGSVLGTGGKLPKLTSIGALATALGKAINTKPLTGTANRVDELGELSAELTRSAITGLGANATADQLASTIGSIGSSVMKSLSAALLQNGGAFAADLKDSAGDIGGAIAQTVSVLGRDSSVIASDKVTALLESTGKLQVALSKAAKSFGTEVTTSFSEVRTALASGGDRLVPGNEPLGSGEVPASSGSIGTATTGKYEIGSLIDAQAQFATLP